MAPENFTEQFTTASQDLINQSARIANELKHPTLQPLHTLYAALDHDFCRSFLQHINVDLQQLKEVLEI